MVALELSIIIPTFNEAEGIEKCLKEIAVAVGRDLASKTEIIIVDDGTDNLNNLIPSLAKELPFYSLEYVRNIPRIGKGQSVARGVVAAKGEVIGYLDADNSTPPSYIKNVKETLSAGLADGFIASRRAPGAKVVRKQFFLKDILGHLLYVFANGIVFAGMKRFTDTQCGFKFFRHRVAKMIYGDLIAPDGLADLEILLRANLLGMNIIECGVEWTDVRESKRTLRRILWGELISMAKILYCYKIVPYKQRKKLDARKSEE